jgi:DedD protein
MNQELKQRLIGAVVVTALAAIFIPMLFDDPIDNSGQSVHELVIPPTPVVTGEVSANKLPSSANQVLNAPDSGSESIINTDEETELSAENVDEPLTRTPESSEQALDEPINDNTSSSLDTGVVQETNKPAPVVKVKPKASPTKEPAVQAATSEPPVSAVKPIKNTEAPTTKVAENIPLSTTVSKPVKPKTEFSRWTIQAGSFSKKENAVAHMETMRKLGLPVTLDTIVNASNVPMYRLKIGPTLDKKRAAEMKAKLDGQKIPSMMIAE